MDIKQNIEGILFLHGEPISVKKIAQIIGEKPAAVLESLRALKKEYAPRGLRLIVKDDEWQMVTAPELSAILETLIKEEYSAHLSKAALEVLAIVAYKGPLTRSEVEYIRGVNSVYSLRNLLMRGLIERRENPVDGRSHLYSVTFNFLRNFGFSDIHELPHYEEFHKTEIPNAETSE